jgi:hypothetical protein
VQCIGYALDEKKRSEKKHGPSYRFPLIEYGITEKDAIEICYRHGFDWGGLYEHFDRVSCFCCPLQKLGELRKLRRFYPDLWQRMLDMEKDLSPEANRGFKDYKTVHDLEARFGQEDCQLRFAFENRQNLGVSL